MKVEKCVCVRGCVCEVQSVCEMQHMYEGDYEVRVCVCVSDGSRQITLFPTISLFLAAHRGSPPSQCIVGRTVRVSKGLWAGAGQTHELTLGPKTRGAQAAESTNIRVCT